MFSQKYLAGEGDVIRHLAQMGYTVAHTQVSHAGSSPCSCCLALFHHHGDTEQGSLGKKGTCTCCSCANRQPEHCSMTNAYTSHTLTPSHFTHPHIAHTRRVLLMSLTILSTALHQISEMDSDSRKQGGKEGRERWVEMMGCKEGRKGGRDGWEWWDAT